MAFYLLLFIFLLFLWFAWLEQKEGNTNWAIIFLIASLAILIMSLIAR